MIKRTLQIKKETEWIYIMKIKESSHQNRKILEKKWGKITTNNQRPNNE